MRCRWQAEPMFLEINRSVVIQATNDPSTWYGRKARAPADHPAKPDKHSHMRQRAAGSQRQPKRHKNANLTMPKQEPHEILGVPQDATEAQVRKGLPKVSPQKTPGQGRRRRRVSEAPGGLRGAARRRWGEEAKESSPASSPRPDKPTRAPPKAKPSKRFRCATCGKRFSSHLALRAHSVEHMKDEDDEARRAAELEGPRSSPQKGRERRRRAGAAAAPAAAGPRDQRRLRGLRPAAFGGGESSRWRHEE